MAIKSSEFYKKLETLERARQTGIANLRAKGLDVSDLSSIPNVVNKIKDIPFESNTTVLQTTGDRIIYAADLPDTNLLLKKNDVLIQTKTTPSVTGGVVDFVVEQDGDYTLLRSGQSLSDIYEKTTHTLENISTDYVFEEDEEGYYYNTNGNAFHKSSYALCKISFIADTNDSLLVVDIKENYGDSYITGIFSNIDMTLNADYKLDSKDKIFFRGRVTEQQRIIYSGISAGEHFIYVKFRRQVDSSYSSYMRFKINSIRNYLIDTVNINGVGKYKILSSEKNMGSYSWSDIQLIANNHYAQYMFDLGSTKSIFFMGYSRSAKLIDFENTKDINGNSLNMTFSLVLQQNYKWDSKSANVSWVGCTLRANCLEKDDIQYIYDSTVSSSTSGVYYIWDNENKVFVQKTLPDEYATNTKYYKMSVVLEDGAFIASLKSALGDVSPAVVLNDTWSGWGGNVTSEKTALEDNTIIRTQDKIWLMSDSNVFGDTNRVDLINNTSKYGYEGKHFEYYKIYTQDRFAHKFQSDLWFRSPVTRYNNYVNTLNDTGGIYHAYVTYNNFPLLCFSL